VFAFGKNDVKVKSFSFNFLFSFPLQSGFTRILKYFFVCPTTDAFCRFAGVYRDLTWDLTMCRFGAGIKKVGEQTPGKKLARPREDKKNARSRRLQALFRGFRGVDENDKKGRGGDPFCHNPIGRSRAESAKVRGGVPFSFG
jgi:hypothetical protein